MTSHPPELREKIARIIDPAVWSKHDEIGKFVTYIQGIGPSLEKADAIMAILSSTPTQAPGSDEVREALEAGVRAAKLALFVIRKQGVMPNSSWENGFNKDLAKAEAGLAALSTPAQTPAPTPTSTDCVMVPREVFAEIRRELKSAKTNMHLLSARNQTSVALLLLEGCLPAEAADMLSRIVDGSGSGERK